MRALVLGAGGFLGGHMILRLKAEGAHVTAVGRSIGYFGDLADDFQARDLTQEPPPLGRFDEVYQFAADMGGAGYLFDGTRDFSVMSNNMRMNLNVARWAAKMQPGRLFFASSACVYGEWNNHDPDDPQCSEESAYPALPDNEYGWEKLFAERLYTNLAVQHGVE